MVRKKLPVAEAIDTLDQWASAILEHSANDRTMSRVAVEVRQAVGNIEAIAKASLTGELRRDFHRSSLNLLDVVEPLLRPADRAACDRLRRVIESAE